MRYPELTDSQRQLLFDIVETSREAGPDHGSIFVLIFEHVQGTHTSILIEATLDEPTVKKESRGDYVTLKTLEDAGYLRIDPREKRETTRVIALTQLALDYFGWYQKPRAYKAFSSKWANLSGEEKGVIIALVIPPLARVLWELAGRFL